MPLRLDTPMAWKLLNHLSTASRSSSLHRLSAAFNFESMTQIYFGNIDDEGLGGVLNRSPCGVQNAAPNRFLSIFA